MTKKENSVMQAGIALHDAYNDFISRFSSGDTNGSTRALYTLGVCASRMDNARRMLALEGPPAEVDELGRPVT